MLPTSSQTVPPFCFLSQAGKTSDLSTDRIGTWGQSELKIREECWVFCPAIAFKKSCVNQPALILENIRNVKCHSPHFAVLFTFNPVPLIPYVLGLDEGNTSLVTGTEPCFGFVQETVLIIQGCVSHCWAALIQHQGFLTPPTKGWGSQECGREHSHNSWHKGYSRLHGIILRI